jgi:FHA domain
MPTALLGLLKLCLLALVYLFFVRVLWAVWNEVRSAPAAAGDAPPVPVARRDARPAGGGTRTASAGHVTVTSAGEAKGQVFDLADEVTIGRAATCTVSLPSDTYLSQMHARLFREDGQAYLEDLGSTNGTWLNGERIAAVAPVDAGDRVQVGGTVLEAS